MDGTQHATHSITVTDDGYIEIKHHANIRSDRSFEILKQALEASTETPRRILCDASNVGSDDTRAQQFKFSLNLAKTGLRVEDKIAVIVEPHSTEHDFVEDAAHGAGYPNVRLFRVRAKAIAFLTTDH